ncbi:DUF2075 domain-containing protein [Chitinophaga deserti]|uniref:DUF2075 domain-containing protein n=1 Tax=Chitinophaga deserti TaxID=2164099 RepID=UPI000D6CEA7A|nr:DUF2075 domain-containing protein [Chitinophaga deserti]
MNYENEYSICEHSFDKEIIGKISDYHFAEDFWPVVYMLTEKGNKKLTAYVGETIDIITRFTNHLNHPEKSKLHEALLISGDKFNKSATLDIESNCIKYMSGDGKYKLLNANIGLADHSYYQKEELYTNIFRALWDTLRIVGLAKHSLKEITNSDLFKYSPYKTLSSDQTKSLILILRSLLDDNFDSIVIEGGAGSGKTVLAVFLFKLLHTPVDDFNFSIFGPEDQLIVELVLQLRDKYPNPRMALVIAMESFRTTVQKIFRNVAGLREEMVVSPNDLAKNHYDIILVDEAHRLRRRKNLGAYIGDFDAVSKKLGFDKEKNHELDWVLARSDKNILFYDEFQSIKPSDIPQEVFDMLKNQPKTKTEYLYSQFRVKGGLKYIKFITSLLQAELSGSSEKIKLKKYEFIVFHDLQQMLDQIRIKNEEEQLARMLAGFAWPWVSKKRKNVIPKDFDIELGSLKLKWNSTTKNWINSPNAINEVGCIHTVMGCDLNYAGIIFGHEIGYDKEKGEIIVREDHYFDKNGKHGIKDPNQLKNFIINIYKTMMLRGIKGTYIYICDEALREYFSRYIPVFGEAAPVS